MMCDADKDTALALRGLSRRTVGSGRQTHFADVTSEQSRKTLADDRAKRTAKITVVPFVPALSPVGRIAEAVLVFGVAFLSLVGVISMLVRQVM